MVAENCIAIPLPASKRFKDLTGKELGNWHVLSYAGQSSGGQSLWMCRCRCGTVKKIRGNHIQDGNTKWCKKCLPEIRITHGATRGGQDSPAYTAWLNMLQRCYNPRKTSFPYYGARGIQVCESWRHSFSTFLSNMGEKPSPNHSIERRDNNGPYSPENCYWATKATQSRNRRGNRWLTFRGETKIMRDWATDLGMRYLTLWNRIKRGWPVEKALLTPVNPPKTL